MTEVSFDEGNTRVFPVMYRPYAVRITQFLPKHYKLLHLSNSLKHENLVIGDFNIEFLKDHQDRTNYGKLPTAFDLEVHTFEPTGLKANSQSCIDHMLSIFQLQTNND